jgi:hypothetical protein
MTNDAQRVRRVLHDIPCSPHEGGRPLGWSPQSRDPAAGLVGLVEDRVPGPRALQLEEAVSARD